MESLYRSEEMSLFQLFLHNEVAYECVSELGELELVQFRDLNADINIHQRRFMNEVRRCDNMECKLRYLEEELTASISKTDRGEYSEAPEACELDELESDIGRIEHELREVNNNLVILKQNLLQLTELSHILRKADQFFEEEGECSSTESISRGLVSGTFSAEHKDMQLGFITGVITRERFPAFERMLWRAYRGNVYLRQVEIETPLEEPSTGNPVYKSVFMILFQEQLRERVKKICDGFGTSLYLCPDSESNRREMNMAVLSKIQDLYIVLDKTQDLRIRLLLAASKYVQKWRVKIIKMKAIYQTLNLLNLDITHKCLIGEFWLPIQDVEAVKMALQRGMKRSDSVVPPIMNQIETTIDPPTFMRTNKFTNGFQSLIDAYGVANYREVNPAPYTIITFPFLFAVMFGDIGHGIILLLFASWMIVMEKKIISKNMDSDIGKILFGGRYVILLMGMFSVYTGFIYNDMFSKSLNMFGSHWDISLTVKDMMEDKHIRLDPKKYYINNPYPIGIDPVWQLSQNKIRFLNAYKMKISIIIGVFHMLFGISLNVLNYAYFKRKVDILLLFFPEILFMLSLFLYLVFLIFIKWVIYGANNPVETGPGCAPSILVTFINMVMFSPGPVNGQCSPWMFEGQEYIQHLLVIVALLCIPWLLLAKPYHTLKRQKNLENLQNLEREQKILEDNKHVDKTELWINQAIHTIEHVLGSVSHTASYLRLWALSLAHAQLSEVLWNMIMKPGLMSHSYFGGIILFLVFAFWAILTIGILVLMEGLSAFLHTLRLHWVEFQSKFYVGAGQAFMPFSFNVILNQVSYVRSEHKRKV